MLPGVMLAPRATMTSFALLAVVIGCGVSFQSVYEGDVRFEHCHRLDVDGRIAPSYRDRCWREWLDHYTYGQTRDRVDYARRRIREMESGTDSSSLRPGDVDAGAAPMAPEAPIPTSPHSPPPRIAVPASATPPPRASAIVPPDAGPDAAKPPALTPPQVSCVEPCTVAWRSCVASGCADAGTACRACGKDYRACMRRCFR